MNWQVRISRNNVFRIDPVEEEESFCNILANKDASRQNLRMAAMGYDVWKSEPWHESGDPGVKRQIFDINCRYLQKYI